MPVISQWLDKNTAWLLKIFIKPFIQILNHGLIMFYCSTRIYYWSFKWEFTLPILCLRDRWQVTFVTLNRFYPLSKNPPLPPPPPTPSPVFLTENIKLDGISTKIKWKIHACFIFYFEFWERFFGTSVKSYNIHDIMVMWCNILLILNPATVCVYGVPFNPTIWVKGPSHFPKK